jgi:hypothetical protein
VIDPNPDTVHPPLQVNVGPAFTAFVGSYKDGLESEGYAQRG